MLNQPVAHGLVATGVARQGVSVQPRLAKSQLRQGPPAPAVAGGSAASRGHSHRPANSQTLPPRPALAAARYVGAHNRTMCVEETNATLSGAAERVSATPPGAASGCH